MELLRLFTCTISTKWPEVEAWKVMTQLQEIYQPNDVQSIAEGRYKLGNLKMGADQNPSILFFSSQLWSMHISTLKGGKHMMI